MSDNDKKYVVQLVTTAGQATEQEANEASIYFMKDKELTGRVETLESKTQGYVGSIKETLKDTDDDDKNGIGALSYTRTAADIPLNGSLIVKNGNNLAAYDSEGNVWLRDEVTENAATWNNKWNNFLEKPANNDSYVLTRAYNAAQIGTPPDGTDANLTLWSLIMELQERIDALETKQKTLTGVNFDIDTDTTGYKLILILGDNTAFNDGSGVEIADKVEQALQENNVGVVWLRNDSSIDLYKYLSSYYTAYQASGEPAADAKPAILINSDNEEMFISSTVRNNFEGNFIALSDFALIIFIANGGDLDNANRYGASSGNYSYIGGAINPNSVKINVSESQEMQVRINKPVNYTGGKQQIAWETNIQNMPNYVPNSYNSEGNYAYIKVQVPTTVTSSVNTVYAMEASVLKLVQTAAPDSVIRVVNPITWNINGNTDTSSAYQSAKTTLLSGLKSFCTNYGYVFKEIYSINDNNRKSTMDLASKTVTSTAAINNYIKNLCSLINEALALTTIVVSSSNGNKSGQLVKNNTVTFTEAGTKSLTLNTDNQPFTITTAGNYVVTFTSESLTSKPDNIASYSPYCALTVYRDGQQVAADVNSNGKTFSLTNCDVGTVIKYHVVGQGSITVNAAGSYSIKEMYKWTATLTTANSQNNS